ncbi:acyl-CoA carboxylase subunit beta [Alkalicoccobacillus porphyridii]|uniref:Acyl-CoA carboxylase subunit beta n=1 Tax=Alkalicoccobacillus porphyridii TaxID=2597270 RepID=A0A553ZXJ7_9BACI|nr:acyl-CoA carboxylase subunit beta [Alkalicoccobacillus porphyridii]TSB46164.1 acyl-CoA carboxylase subunit beta [Alkalicoccobacillus porphyridii]
MHGKHALENYQKQMEQIQAEEEIKKDKQRHKGKYSARERVEMLLDPDSWTEFQQFASGSLSDKTLVNDGVIIGVGTIDGRKVCVFSQDFTVAGGSLGEIHAKKISWLMDLAADMNVPLIGLNDSGGARIQEGISALEGYGQIFERNVKYSGVIPQISVILGPCAGGAVYSPALTDFVLMVEKSSQMFITGPKVVKAMSGVAIEAEALGGAYMHASQSGNAHLTAISEEEAFKKVRKLIALWTPQTHHIKAPQKTSLINLLPAHHKKSYDMHTVISSIIDEDSFLEIHEKFARNLIVGFARLNGRCIGIVANNPKVMAGCIDLDASDKCARFIRFCDAFEHPILVLEDVSGFMPGLQQEQAGLIRHGAKIIYAFAEASVPKITVIIRKAYGGAFVALNSKAIGADFVYAWPGSEVSVMGPEGAAAILYSDQSQKSKEEKMNEYRDQFADSRHAAQKALIDEIIHPDDTRKRLIMSFSLIQSKKRSILKKKHGNMPL